MSVSVLLRHRRLAGECHSRMSTPTLCADSGSKGLDPRLYGLLGETNFLLVIHVYVVPRSCGL